jgi:MerR family mercuric resistance operon transcriptional regulator
MPDVYTIGALAQRAGVNVQTIRYYQRRGLLACPPLPPRSIRRYGVQAVRQVQFIKRAQQLGFTLHEVSELLALAQGRSCAPACGLAERKRADIEKKIADLTAMQQALARLSEGCRNTAQDELCPLVEVLAGAQR